jgi:molybdopterin/thiamine biosynthesis adenylyltransferase
MSTATLIGLGNIGSRTADLLARMPGVTGLILVDHDSYAEKNLASQSIATDDVGRLKVDAQAARLRAINPALEIQTFAERTENVPLAALVSSALLSCVDNRRARQALNRIAHRLGIPLIDTGVDSSGLVRVSSYIPGMTRPCLECGWDATSYGLLEAEYPCAAGSDEGSAAASDARSADVPETDAPAELGALAAALQALTLRKLLAVGAGASSFSGSQLMWNTTTHERHLTRFRRNDRCSFDHETWAIEHAALDVDRNTLGDLFEAVNAGSSSTLRLDGHIWITHLDCVACGIRKSRQLYVYGRLEPRARACACGGQLYATGFFSFDAITNGDLSIANRNLRLAAIGLQPLDVVSISNAEGAARHLRLGGRGVG